MTNTHKPFHQKYRPNNLDELLGQEFISITLKQALLSKKIAPAYLFNGPRGTGKTSSARIFAKSLNCQSYEEPTVNPCGKCELCKQITDGIALDIIEIDAASNTGVENIREIIERSRFAPSQARWKVYVIDECHMLSTAASNALLKTIEEPPDRVVFILATTNPERVLNTIQSRCQKFDFRRISSNDIFQHLNYIANKESIKFQDQALKLIAKRANGGMRDAQSLLEQLSLLPNGITTKNVQNLLGEVSENDMINLINSLIDNNPESLLISCNNLYDDGNEPNQIIIGLLNITRDLLLKSINNTYTDLYYTSIEFQNELNKFASNLDKSRIINWHNKLKNVEYQIKTSDNPRLWLEIHLTSLLDKQTIKNIDDNKLNQNFKKNNSLENIDNKELKFNNPQNQIAPGEKENLDFDNTKNISKEIQPEAKVEKITKKEFISRDLQNIKKTINKDDFDSDDIKETSKNSQNNARNNLKEKWQLILSKLELPSTKMLLSQQAELISFDSHEVVIALSPNWETMIKSRKVIIEDSVKKIFGDEIKLNFTVKEITNRELNKAKEKINSNINDTKLTTNIDTREVKSSEASSQTNLPDKSSENLAKFFNGEIIELDD